MQKKQLIVVLGPTATGKTQLAVSLADKMDGEIISADSRQVYQGMDIGTGKDIEEYALPGKKIPYHLIDIVSPGEEYNVYRFQKDFVEAYESILKRQKQAILCGGTGMYIEAVLKGYELIRVPENKALRNSLHSKTDNELVKLLSTLKDLHNTTDVTDRERTIRAIEIVTYYQKHQVGNTFPEIQSVVFGVKMERQEIRSRITKRLKTRLEQGLVEEVERLLNSGLKPDQLTFYGLEYRYVTLYLMKELSYEQMFEKLNIAIHQFAKRQMTWFRRMEKKGIHIHWLEKENKVKEALTHLDFLI